MRRHGRLSKAFLGCLAFGVTVLIGLPADAQFSMTSREIERAVRVDWMQMKRSLPRPENPAIQAFVECVANALIAQLDEPYSNMDWEIVVFDDDSLNAFAMPGGKIGVFTGIFKAAETPDGLAAVIGHEIAHVTEDHVISQARRQVGTDLLARAGGAMTGFYGYSSEFTRVLLSLPFSRRDESEADLVGLQYMADAGFDPRATMYLWKNMSDMREGGEQAEFLSTHPSDVRRLDDIVASITPALIKYNQALEAGRKPDCLGNG